MKRNIAIVAGGDSSEHEVSLRSAAGLKSFMDSERYNITIVVLRGADWKALVSENEQVDVDKNDFLSKLLHLRKNCGKLISQPVKMGKPH